MAKIKYKEGDLVGVNNILFIKRTTKSNNGQWNAIFQCPYCGNEFESKIANVANGHTASCGCLRSPNLVGKQFGRLTVIKNLKTNSKGRREYECICECGNKTVVEARHLVDGRTTSCGCYQKECIAKVGSSMAIDLTGKRFGKLVAIKLLPKSKGQYGTSRWWLCRCDCGNYTNAPTGQLNIGSIQSCGKCHFSRGEQEISRILQSLCINYVTEYIFNDCINPKTNKYLRFDFYLSDINTCIEYDGIQHFEETTWRHEALSETQYRDSIKNKYCEEHGINLIRIPYWDYDKLSEDYLMELIENAKNNTLKKVCNNES